MKLENLSNAELRWRRYVNEYAITAKEAAMLRNIWDKSPNKSDVTRRRACGCRLDLLDDVGPLDSLIYKGFAYQPGRGTVMLTRRRGMDVARALVAAEQAATATR